MCDARQRCSQQLQKSSQFVQLVHSALSSQHEPALLIAPAVNTSCVNVGASGAILQEALHTFFNLRSDAFLPHSHLPAVSGGTGAAAVLL